MKIFDVDKDRQNPPAVFSEYRTIAILTHKQPIEVFLTAIDTQLQKEPDNVQLLMEKAQIYRRIAAFERSLSSYSQVLKLDADNACANTADQVKTIAYAKTAQSILSGAPVSYLSTCDLQPAPFVRYRDFFPSKTVETFFNTAVSRQTEFIHAGITEKHVYNPDKRQTLALADIGEIKTQFRRFLRQNLPEYCQRLGIVSFTPGKIETKMTNHLDGGFFKPHRDTLQLLPCNGRCISYLYYFHRQPKRFNGGDLILFDTSLERNQYKLSQFTRIPCEHNSLTLFPSGWFHCVEPVRLAGNRFEDGRMAITGHIHYGGNDQCRS